MKRTGLILLCACLLCGCTQKNSGSTADGSQTDYACRVMDSYDYTATVPASDAVDESYYADALFAGDSRMGSLSLFGSHPDAEVDYVTSLNLAKIDSMPADERDDKKTLMDLLNETTRSHIYLLFGINEIRNTTFEYFAEEYQDIITDLKNNNPNVQIYIILSYHPREISGLDDEQLNAQLKDLNDHMTALASSNYVYCLQPDDGLDDDTGMIREEYVWDGLHLNPDGTHAFEDYLATHAVRSEEYVQEICE